MATHALWNLLQQLKSDYEWVELSHEQRQPVLVRHA